ncbi:hypothetical protein M0802_005492 [Mischocyttarus mexicanus]|nr:hypothetical protein M0802_005492 [Mischocyttarus mexicanus]
MHTLAAAALPAPVPKHVDRNVSLSTVHNRRRSKVSGVGGLTFVVLVVLPQSPNVRNGGGGRFAHGEDTMGLSAELEY